MEGVGVKIAAKIDEILATGQLEKLENAKNDPKQVALNLFNRIHGIGPVTARKFIDDGVMTIEQLKAKIADNTYTLTHEQVNIYCILFP